MSLYKNHCAYSGDLIIVVLREVSGKFALLFRYGLICKAELCMSHDCRVLSRVRSTRAESRVESRVIAFSRGRVPSRVASHQSRVPSRVTSHKSRIRVFASHCQGFSSHVSSHCSAVGRVNVTKSVLKILK